MEGEIPQEIPAVDAPISEDECLSQDSYQETPYEDSTWEIIGDAPKTIQFVPMDIPVLPQDRAFTDPMFADYGGIPEQFVPQRWHLPEELALTAPAASPIASGGVAAADAEIANDQALIAEEEVERRCNEAYERGKEEALAQAVLESNERLGQAESRIQETLVDLQQQITEATHQIEQQALVLAVDVAKKLVDTAVEIDPDYISKLVHEALGYADEDRVYQIRVSPEDYKFVHFIGLEQRIKSEGSQWEFVADESIQAGCILDMDTGTVNFDLDQAWEKIKAKVMQLIP